MTELTKERIDELYEYDKSSGCFLRRFPSGKRPIGSVAGYNVKGYLSIFIDKKNYRVHRLVWFYENGEWPKGMIDHINGIKDDNRIENLRDVTRSQNMMNMSKFRAKSGIKGVKFCKRVNKWCGVVTVEGKFFQTKYFDNKNDAGIAVAKLREKHHGEFANHGKGE